MTNRADSTRPHPPLYKTKGTIMNMHASPKTAYHNLRLLDSVDAATGAAYRQQAQEAIADPNVKPMLKLAIADRLNHANQDLAHTTATENDSY
jgi:hypothetical protein